MFSVVSANNQFTQRLRQRFDLSSDLRLSNPAGQVTYDGKLDLGLKFGPKAGPHTLSFDVNRLKEDAMNVDVSFQPRYDNSPMNLRLKANLPQTNPISIKCDERRNSPTNFRGILKYSFDANNDTAEKTYQCDVHGPDSTDVSIKCKAERTNLDVDIESKTGKSKVLVELNRFKGEKIGYEVVRNPQTQEIDATLYTLITSCNLQRKPGKSTTLSIKQNDKEVYRMEGTRVNSREIQVKFSPANINLGIETDNSAMISIKQISPQARDLVRIAIDREELLSYLSSLRNQDRPALDIDEPMKKSSKPLIEIALDSQTLVSISEALDKLGSHNGLYGLYTTELPESYSIRVVNNANGNFIQLATNKWNEERIISEVSHSFDGGKTLTTDLKLDGNYIHLNPACDYVLAHDFVDLQFSFRFINGKVHSFIPNQGEIKNNECSNTSRVQFCKEGSVYRISVPMYYGGRVNGALGDVRDRNGTGHADPTRWLAQAYPAASRNQPEKGQRTLSECDSDNDDEQEFCENFVRNGLKEGKDRRDLLTQIYDLRGGLV